MRASGKGYSALTVLPFKLYFCTGFVYCADNQRIMGALFCTKLYEELCARTIYGRITTVGVYPNSIAASKQGQDLIHSLGSTIPLSFKSGDVSRCPSTSIILNFFLSRDTNSTSAIFCAGVRVSAGSPLTFSPPI